jgi:hypothetical protein
VSIKGSPYSHFRGALTHGSLDTVLLAAKELPTIGLEDALEIVVRMAREHDNRFDRAAAKWVGRLMVETPLGLTDARLALALIERLPAGAETLRRLARRR